MDRCLDGSMDTLGYILCLLFVCLCGFGCCFWDVFCLFVVVVCCFCLFGFFVCYLFGF